MLFLPVLFTRTLGRPRVQCGSGYHSFILDFVTKICQLFKYDLYPQHTHILCVVTWWLLSTWLTSAEQAPFIARYCTCMCKHMCCVHFVYHVWRMLCTRIHRAWLFKSFVFHLIDKVGVDIVRVVEQLLHLSPCPCPNSHAVLLLFVVYRDSVWVWTTLAMEWTLNHLRMLCTPSQR